MLFLARSQFESPPLHEPAIARCYYEPRTDLVQQLDWLWHHEREGVTPLGRPTKPVPE